jgi:ParB/RepB/Spo0J family partition protein
MEVSMAIIDKIHEIPLKDIREGNLNVRTTDKEAGVDDLAASIKKYGLLQPIILKGEFGKPPYDLVVGQRRYRAHQKLNKDSIRAVFYEKASDLELKMLSLSENMQREKLNYSDMAEAITTLYKEFGNNARKVAKELGVSPSTIYDYVKIDAQATPMAKELLRKRQISRVDVKRVIMAAQGDPREIDRLLIDLPKLTKYEKDRAVDYGRKVKAPAAKIIEEAKKPRFERTVILNLDKDTDDALTKAGEKLFLDREAIAELALEKWLKENGFLKETTERQRAKT